MASNLMVKALAGTGKTTTMIWSVGSVPAGVKLSDEQEAIRDWFQAQKIKKFRFLAFNKSIATELASKVPGYCEAATCHSSGLAIIKANVKSRSKVDSWKYRKIMDRLFGDPKKPEDYRLRDALNKLADVARANMFGCDDGSGRLVLDADEVSRLRSMYDVNTETDDASMTDLLNRILAVGSVDMKSIDFTDMIWMPVHHQMKATKVGGLIVDECFPAGTKVFTAEGLVSIEHIAQHPEHDWQVLSSVDGGKTLKYSAVTSAYKTPIKTHLVKVKHEKGEIICTANHPFWARGRGWVQAGLLTKGDELPNLRRRSEEGISELLPKMCGSVEEAEQKSRSGKASTREDFQTYERGSQRDTESYGTCRGSCQSIENFEIKRPQTFDTRREWEGTDRTSDVAVSSVGSSLSSLAMEPRVCSLEWTKRETKERASLSLQNRYSFFSKEDSDRSGWGVTRDSGTSEAGYEEGYTTEEVRVVSVEIYEPTSDGQCGSMCGDNNYVYTLSVEDGSYFAEGLLVKNCQDLNAAQQGLVAMQGHQIICVGDVNQAIYGFAGADAYSMGNLEKMLGERGGVDVLPLTMTRRCGKQIVNVAKQIVPEYRAAEENGEGEVVKANLTVEQLVKQFEQHSKSEDDVMVLCRTNAPLVGLAFSLMKNQIPVMIRGRDIGQGIVKLIEKMAGKSNDVSKMIANLQSWSLEEEGKIVKRYRYGVDEKIMLLQDKVSCIMVLSEDCDGVNDLVNKINGLFQDRDNKAGTINLSSVHKAKGLEADTVYIYRSELLPHPKLVDKPNGNQEFNLQYVAYTRAINKLVILGQSEM